jgi:hypothetical protein
MQTREMFVPGVMWMRSTWDTNNFKEAQTAQIEGGEENKNKEKLRGLSPLANYIDRTTAACWRKLVSTFADRRSRMVSTADPHGRILGFLGRSRSGLRSRLIASQKNLLVPGIEPGISGFVARNSEH